MFTKQCSVCREDKSREDFHKHSGSKDGLSDRCAPCATAKTKEWYWKNLEATKLQRKQHREANPEKIREQKRQYYLRNKEAIKAKTLKYFRDNREDRLEKKRAYHHANKERCNAKKRKWNQDNPGRRREQQWKYKAQKKNQLGFLPDKFEDLLWDEQEGLCFYCQADLKLTGYHLDHMAPLSRGGLHDISNLCLACPDCNLSKGTKTAEEFTSPALRSFNETS